MVCAEAGVLIIESDIVTGNLSNGNGTPNGAYYIKYKELNATLKGPGYSTGVSYWMPFNESIGLHDAKWRGSFGGSIYKSAGSHGCINLPFLTAQTIYNNVSPGGIVICYTD
jgi:lipoprotein-anchoring transpeptidase ErfK/SrfK